MNWCISLKPKYASAIMEGRKRFELRTRLPNFLAEGDTIFVCVSGSKGKIPFSFKVRWRRMYFIETAWKIFNEAMAISEEDFRKYIGSRTYVYLIALKDIQVFDHSLDISELGLKTPPMWFTRISTEVTL